MDVQNTFVLCVKVNSNILMKLLKIVYNIYIYIRIYIRCNTSICPKDQKTILGSKKSLYDSVIGLKLSNGHRL